jgi:hypothetical protein
LWQVSQLVIATPASVWYGMCVAGRPSAGGNAPLWQVEHWPLTVTCVWFQAEGFHAVTLWQVVQLAAPTGMCVEDRPTAVVPLWQLAQLVAEVNVLWSTLAPDQLVVDLWQLSHTVTPLWIGVLGLPTAGAKLPVWQVAHCVPTPTDVWNLAGVQAPKPALWQVSQLVIATPASDWYGM